MLDTPDVLAYMQAYQQYTPLRVLPSQAALDIVSAVSNGDCDGAVLVDVDFADALARRARH